MPCHFVFLSDTDRHEETAKVMVAKLGRKSSATEAEAEALGLDVHGIVRLFGALQSNGFASGIYLHPAMTNHSCRRVAVEGFVFRNHFGVIG